MPRPKRGARGQGMRGRHEVGSSRGRSKGGGGLAAAALVTALATGLAGAADPVAPPPGAAESLPSDPELEASGAVFGRILFDRRNIFDTSDPKENNGLFRLANKLHPRTRESTIRSLLVFREGDPYSAQRMRESERVLRATGFIREASIRAVRVDAGRVDVLVTTQDVWTLNLGAGIGRSGGVNRTRLGIDESNVFGTGKGVAVKYLHDADRSTVTFRYTDPAVAGSRWTLAASYGDSSDGREWNTAVERPFYSLDTRWAVGFSALDRESEESFYENGRVVAGYRLRRTLVEAYAGFSHGLRRGRTHRWYGGYTYEREMFSDRGGLPVPPGLPPGRTVAYPWFGWELTQDRFVAVRELDRIRRTEDLNLGTEAQARLGWASTALGADRNRLIFKFSARHGRSLTPDQVLVLWGSVSGRLYRGGVENLNVGTSLRWYLRDWGRHVLFAAVRFDALEEPDGEAQLLLGGDNGLRGYPQRLLSGDRRLVLTVEQRFYTHVHLLRLFHLGAAVFFDAGRAWFAGQDGPLARGFLRDIGAGLRLESSRSGFARMIRIDAAFPLDRAGTVRSYQILVTSSDTF